MAPTDTPQDLRFKAQMSNLTSWDLPNLVKTTCIQNTRFNGHVRAWHEKGKST